MEGDDSRDAIWDGTFKVYYESFWSEIVAQRIVTFWQRLDDFTKVLVAITASGSAIAGWALWKEDNFKYIWLTLAAISALLSIIHASLAVANRIKDWTETTRQFVVLRIELERCMENMKIDKNFDVPGYLSKYNDYMGKYADLYSTLKNDILRTRNLEIKVQHELNERLKDLIQ